MVWSCEKDAKQLIAKITNKLETGRKEQKRTTEKSWSNNLRHNIVNYELSEADAENRSEWRKKLHMAFG